MAFMSTDSPVFFVYRMTVWFSTSYLETIETTEELILKTHDNHVPAYEMTYTQTKPCNNIRTKTEANAH